METNQIRDSAEAVMRRLGPSSSASFPPPFLRYIFYAFIFTIPIETLDIGIERGLLSLSSLAGYLLIGSALLRPAFCFKKPPVPFWLFWAYLILFVCLGITQEGEYTALIVKRVITLIQMLVLFWISFSLLQDQRLTKEAFLALGAGCVLLSILQVGGGAAERIGQGRVSALSQDANNLGSVLSLGLLCFLGLAYGRSFKDARISLLTWTCFGSLTAGIVLTGSRGAFLSLLAGLLLLMARPGKSAARIKTGVIAVFAICCLVLASYTNDAVRIRWERTLLKGNMAGREKIMPVAWKMFTEAPMLGWGTGRLTSELGRRLGKQSVDTHNGYLWVMTETGLLGALPFFIGLGLSWRAAWNARFGSEGSLPLALLTCVFVVNMSLTWHYRKLFWIVLAYALASNTYANLQAPRHQAVAHRSRAMLPVEALHIPARR